MSRKLNYYLWFARSGYVLSVGMIVAVILLRSGSSTAAVSTLAATGVIAFVVYLVVDRPRVESRLKQ